jgi:DNA-directed RNA polymerase specialized sigma24 family protein
VPGTFEHGRRDGTERWPVQRGRKEADQAHRVAIVATAKRDVLLRVHRYRLRWQDLEDCYGQATLELLAHVRRGGVFASSRHVSNALEQRFVSRIFDRRRALAGRSPTQATLESAVSLDSEGEALELADQRAELEDLVLLREDLRSLERLARELTADQRLVLACQVGLQMSRAEFCGRFGWSEEKYRKVAQRARARLRRVAASAMSDVPSCARESE